MSGICDDLRVIDLSSGAAGGLATMVLADFGADVIKVEPSGGDPARVEAAAPMWLRGKRSVSLDPCLESDRQNLYALVRGADVVVSSDPDNVAASKGTDRETLTALNPSLVYCQVTPWGGRGPLANYPADRTLVAARGGRMFQFNGIAKREGPGYPAVHAETHAAAQSALTGILAALLVRDRTGLGQGVETSLLQGLFPFDLDSLLRTQLMPRYPVEFANDPFVALTATTPPPLSYLPIRAGDGRWIQLANLMEHLFQSSIVALDLTEEVFADPRLATAPRLGPDEAGEVRALMLKRALERPSDELMQAFRENGNVAAEFLGTAQDGLQHPDLLANGEVVDLVSPQLGPTRQLGPLARLTETPAQISASFPAPGEDTDAVLAEAPRTTAPVAATGDVLPGDAPLSGVVVLEFATVIAAPLGTAFLADMGARVIKVEPTGVGDPLRTMGAGLGAYLIASKTTAGKESISVDLKSEEGRRIVEWLLARADVVVHNYRPGAPERLGIGYEQARALRPDVLYVSVNGYGPDGPSAQRPAAHPIPGAVCGGALLQAGAGWPFGDPENYDDLVEASRRMYRSNEANPDPNTSVALGSAVLLGLYAKRRTGRGQQVFLSMLGANAYANYDDFLSYEGKPARPIIDGDLYGTSALNRLYRAQAGWVMLAVERAGAFEVFCAAIGRDDLLADARFGERAARQEHDAELADALSVVFAEKPAGEWEQLLASAGVGCVEAQASSPGTFFVSAEQMRANGLALEVEHPLWGKHQRWGPMVSFSATPGRYGPGVLAGQHTTPILQELGYSDAEIDGFRSRGVVDTDPPMELSVQPPRE